MPLAERDPRHRMMHIHCQGHEYSINGSSPSNPMQADAVEYLLGAVTNRYTRIPPIILVLTPYRGQHALLTQRLSEYCKGKVKVSTIDAAQRPTS